MPRGVFERTPEYLEKLRVSGLGKNSGKIPWNKGLTKKIDERVRKNGENIKKNHKGMTGKQHKIETIKKMKETKTGKKNSKEHCENIRKSKLGKNNPMYNKKHSLETLNRKSKSMKGKNTGDKTKEAKNNMSKAAIKRVLRESHGYLSKTAGYRKDLKRYFRCRDEANFARYLNYKQIKWEYESKNCIFKLSNNKRYLIDWYFPNIDFYLETKNYDKSRELKKYDLFKLNYPNIKWQKVFWKSFCFKYIEKFGKENIKNWEIYKNSKIIILNKQK